MIIPINSAPVFLGRSFSASYNAEDPVAAFSVLVSIIYFFGFVLILVTHTKARIVFGMAKKNFDCPPNGQAIGLRIWKSIAFGQGKAELSRICSHTQTGK